MAFMRKLIVLAVTSGMAKKAWDAWRGNASRRARAASGDSDRQDTRHARRSDDRARDATDRTSPPPGRY